MWMVTGKASRQVTGDKLGELYRLLVWPSKHGGGSGHMPYPPHHLDRQWRVVPPLLVGARLCNTTRRTGGEWWRLNSRGGSHSSWTAWAPYSPDS